MEEQAARKAREESEGGRDWWEKKEVATPEYGGPHPSQVRGEGVVALND